MCSSILVTERTSGDITIKVFDCLAGKHQYMEKWRRMRAISLNITSKDKENLLREAEYVSRES